VIRLLADLDPVGRMARVLVQIDDPFGLQVDQKSTTVRPGTLPLLINDYVNVDIEGKDVEAGIEVPRVALRDGDSVYVMTAEDKLEIRSVSVVWRERDIALLDSGISEGERVIVSPIAAPVRGMRLRVIAAKDSSNRPDSGSSIPVETRTPAAKDK